MIITYVTSRELELQAEVTRMAQEIEEAQRLKHLLVDCRKERGELRAKLAALEAQEPVAFGLRGSEGLIIDCISPEANARHPGDYIIPLYLAAGAKEPNHG